MLSWTADFYSLGLYKSAHDILRASARKIVRNYLLPRPGACNFLISIPASGRSIPLTWRRTLHEILVCAAVRSFPHRRTSLFSSDDHANVPILFMESL